VASRRLDIVDAERKVVVTPSSQIRRVLTRIVRWPWIEFKQLDLEVRVGAFEHKRDVLSPHARHAHVSRRRTTIDHLDVLLTEAEELEKLDSGRTVRHRDGYVIGVANYLHDLPHCSTNGSVATDYPRRARIGMSSQGEWTRRAGKRCLRSHCGQKQSPPPAEKRDFSTSSSHVLQSPVDATQSRADNAY
jgi:hypothetical protein